MSKDQKVCIEGHRLKEYREPFYSPLEEGSQLFGRVLNVACVLAVESIQRMMRLYREFAKESQAEVMLLAAAVVWS